MAPRDQQGNGPGGPGAQHGAPRGDRDQGAGAIGVRILVVEDDPLIAMDLEAALAGMGHEPCGVSDRAAEAVRLAHERRPDVILMDVQLARGDSGIAAATVIAAELEIPVVFVTANAALVESMPLPFRPAAVIAKPYSDARLRSAIARAARSAPGIPDGT
jgi:CheY-like chemotaxis protein